MRLTVKRTSVSRWHDIGTLNHQYYALKGRSRPVYDAFRHDKSHPRLEGHSAIFKINQKLPIEAEEEFIIVIMLVPVILALHNAEPHHRIVHPTKRLVVPLVGDGRDQRRNIDLLELGK